MTQKIGKGTKFIGRYELNCGEFNFTIGKYCAVGPNFKVILHNHDYNFPAVQNSFYEIFGVEHPVEHNSNVWSKGNSIVGNDVWIGENVLILSGVTIGDGCCIGAGSVVTKSLPAYYVCVGSPCRWVKSRFNRDIVDFLLEIKWWDWSDEKIQNNCEFFMTNLNKTSLINLKEIIK